MGVSKNRGGPPKWMVKIMENPIKMDDLGVPLFLETPKCFFFRFSKNEATFLRGQDSTGLHFSFLVTF